MAATDSYTKVKNSSLSKSLSANIDMFKDFFKSDETFITRMVECPGNPKLSYCLFYCDGMVNNKLINEDVILPLLRFRPEQTGPDYIDILAKQVMLSNSVDRSSDLEELIQGIVYGDTVLLADGFAEGLILNTKGWVIRSSAEPDSERVIRGPREGFTEALMTNLSMIRRRIRTPNLKMEFQTLGERTNTKACICYLEGVVNEKVLTELKNRLKTISLDGILDVNYISELIKDGKYSPVKTIGSTERPDIVAAKLLEGRVALVLDGTPVVLTMPHLFIEHFQSDEDYYLNYVFATINRILRIIAFFFASSMPAIYVSLTTFHHEMLPLALMMSISQARQGVPFPTAIEMVLMLTVFEMLRESGARMPGMLGSALSIVGALVIGQAAVEAKIVSAPMIIIVAITGICGLMIPRAKGFTIMLRYICLLLSSTIGLYGYMFAMLGVLIHLFSLNSFGIPIMNSIYAATPQDKKDILIRSPWWYMLTRPKYLSQNKSRQSKGDSK